MVKNSGVELTEEESFARLRDTLRWSSLGNDFFDYSPVVTYEDAEKYPEMKGCVGNFAVFPIPLQGTEAEKAAEWERKSLLMHDAQVPIRLDAKPADNRLQEIALAKIALERGD